MGLYFGTNFANNITASDNDDIVYGYGGNDILNGGLETTSSSAAPATTC